MQSKIIVSKIMCEFFREKSQIVVLTTFDQREFKKINYFDENFVQCARKGIFYPFSHTVHIFVKIIKKINSRWSKVLKTTIWDFP